MTEYVALSDQPSEKKDAKQIQVIEHTVNDNNIPNRSQLITNNIPDRENKINDIKIDVVRRVNENTRPNNVYVVHGCSASTNIGSNKYLRLSQMFLAALLIVDMAAIITDTIIENNSLFDATILCHRMTLVVIFTTGYILHDLLFVTITSSPNCSYMAKFFSAILMLCRLAVTIIMYIKFADSIGECYTEPFDIIWLSAIYNINNAYNLFVSLVIVFSACVNTYDCVQGN